MFPSFVEDQHCICFFLNFSLGVILESRWEQKLLTVATVPRCPHGIFTVAPRNRQFKRPPRADRKTETYGFETCSQKVRSIIFGRFFCVWFFFFSISAENVLCSVCCEYYFLDVYLSELNG